MLLLLKNCHLYDPAPSGRKDILVGGGRILAVRDRIDFASGIDLEVIDLEEQYVFPGIIDAHVHIAGAGGEGGPASRTPELQIKTMLRSGVTTVVGCLGTDGMTRNVESVLMKVKSIRDQGLSAWMYTGAYQVPTPTITGEVGKDIALIDEVIGVGEIALSDHRSSGPTTAELIRLAAHARVGGMLGGKAGIVNIHMGDAKDPFRPIHDAVQQSELGYKQFFPTHCNRNNHIFEDAKTYGKQGWIDLTTSSYAYYPEIEVKPSVALKVLIEAGVPPEHITMTSDANGSLPDFDADGNLVRLEMGDPFSILTEMKDAIDNGVPLEIAIATVTANPAGILKLNGKGSVRPGMDADILVTDKSLNLVHLIANGNIMVKDGNIIRQGNYE
jgi:beta-aspartyl-dipeptidase (metallo-type)